jgi:4-diphosphocytidyl-2-C-methyl-D-erythritol kinase
VTVVRAPAKINLVLRVGPVRADGFHRLATLFQALDLHDDVEIAPAETTAVAGFEADTLVTRALELLGETAHIRLTKRIPVAGGLGGGSSDAAAVLRHFARRRKVDELYAIARTLGSDVPFFLSGLETALGTGRGDRLQHVTGLPRDYGVVLVPSDRGLSTADVYAACEPNALFDAVRGELIRGVHTARDASGVARLVANDLEPAALALRPELADVLEELRGRGALAAAVSGSGPTVFAILADRSAAEAMAGAIPTAIPCSPL